MNDEKFFAWIDGELTGPEADEVAALVAADPALAERAEQHRALAGRLRAAFRPVVEAPVPAGIAAPLRDDGGRIVSFAGWRKRRSDRLGGGVGQWAAMAATLALGLVVGSMMSSGDGGGPVQLRDGAIYAAAGLDQALETQLASAGAGGAVRVGLTFRDSSGAICRSFSSAESSGLACREAGDWRLEGLFAAPEGQSGHYRMAAGPDPELMALIDARMAGEPFDAGQERRALERGWR